MIDATGFVTDGAAALALLVWFAYPTPRREELTVPVRTSSVVDVLRGRLERGEISPREYEDALGVLRDS